MLTSIFHTVILIGILIAGLAIVIWAALELLDLLRDAFPGRHNDRN